MNETSTAARAISGKHLKSIKNEISFLGICVFFYFLGGRENIRFQSFGDKQVIFSVKIAKLKGKKVIMINLT